MNYIHFKYVNILYLGVQLKQKLEIVLEINPVYRSVPIKNLARFPGMGNVPPKKDSFITKTVLRLHDTNQPGLNAYIL